MRTSQPTIGWPAERSRRTTSRLPVEHVLVRMQRAAGSARFGHAVDLREDRPERGDRAPQKLSGIGAAE